MKYNRVILVLFLNFLITLMSIQAWSQTSDEFSFVRLRWDMGFTVPFSETGVHYWNADHPAADRCFLQSLSEVTNIRVNMEPKTLDISSRDLYRYPFAYIVEAGWVNLSDRETQNLQGWLHRGGFLMVDDFHGPMPGYPATHQRIEWSSWMEQLRKLYPDLVESRQTYSPSTLRQYLGQPVVLRLTKDHPIFNQFFTFEEVPHIKGMRAVELGAEYEFGGKDHYVMGLFDKMGRLSVLMNYNMDVGDGWEYCEQAWQTEYGRVQVPEGLKLGINYIIYSLLH